MRLHSLWLFCLIAVSATTAQNLAKRTNNATVLILGGGMAGVIAARTLHDKGIDDIIVVEGLPELGGRLTSYTFGAKGKQYQVELGPYWIQGTQTGSGPANPVYSLAQKHNLSTVYTDWYGNISG